jgi:hypothetical protein
MTTVHIRQSTTVPLNRLVAALIDFGPGWRRSSARARALAPDQRPRRHLDRRDRGLVRPVVGATAVRLVGI